MILRVSVLAGAVALIAFCGSHSAVAQGVFTLSSPDFKDGARLAVKNTSNNKSNPNCVGENISPALAWSNPPEGTKSYALLMFDPEGRPASSRPIGPLRRRSGSPVALCRGRGFEQTDEFVGGKARSTCRITSGLARLPGPPHHYIFTLIATDLEPTALAPGLTRDELIKALDGRPKGATGLIGTFSKQ